MFLKKFAEKEMIFYLKTVVLNKEFVHEGAIGTVCSYGCQYCGIFATPEKMFAKYCKN